MHVSLLSTMVKAQNFQGNFRSIFRKKFVAQNLGGTQKGGFQKGSFQIGRCSPETKSGTRVRSDAPPERKTGTRVRSHVPPERKPERGHICQNHPFTKPPFMFSDFGEVLKFAF